LTDSVFNGFFNIVGKIFNGVLRFQAGRPREKVSDDVVVALDAMERRTALFNVQSPANNAFGVEVCVSEIFVVGVDVDFCAEKCCAEFFQGSDNGEQFFFNCCVISLRVGKFARIVSDGPVVLHNNCAELTFGSVGVNMKWQVVIWKCEAGVSNNERL